MGTALAHRESRRTGDEDLTVSKLRLTRAERMSISNFSCNRPEMDLPSCPDKKILRTDGRNR